jgi:methyltransferase (TIGR00027 family)
MRRAEHQLFDHPPVLVDPIAVPIIGPQARERLTPAAARGAVARGSRAWMVVRSRFAEDALAQAVANGVRQYVLLGAGLDTFAYRNPHPALRVFEVDHPATQAWKRRKLVAGGISIPSTVTFVAVDFERQSLPDELRHAGLDPEAPAFFAWLGVTMYLTADAFAATLGYIASRPEGSGVAFDYAVPRASLGLFGRFAHDRLAKRVEAAGEPFRTFFDPAELRRRLEAAGFHSIEDLGAAEINARYFANRTDRLRVRGGLARLACAWR